MNKRAQLAWKMVQWPTVIGSRAPVYQADFSSSRGWRLKMWSARRVNIKPAGRTGLKPDLRDPTTGLSLPKKKEQSLSIPGSDNHPIFSHYYVDEVPLVDNSFSWSSKKMGENLNDSVKGRDIIRVRLALQLAASAVGWKTRLSTTDFMFMSRINLIVLHGRSKRATPVWDVIKPFCNTYLFIEENVWISFVEEETSTNIFEIKLLVWRVKGASRLLHVLI